MSAYAARAIGRWSCAKLEALGLDGPSRAAVIGNVVARMAKPGSELAAWRWLQRESALGELIDVNFEAMALTRMYRASDTLLKHRAAIEDHLFASLRSLFALEETVTLYDLTNTYFEGHCAANAKATQGRSKEKRSDCALVTLALVLDGSGFVRRSRLFEGNASEAKTLAQTSNIDGRPGLSSTRSMMSRRWRLRP